MNGIYRDEDVRIVDFPATPVAMLSHRGDPALIDDTIRTFIAWRKLAGLPPRISATFNILYTDPHDTPKQEFRLDLCAATERKILPNDYGVTGGMIPGGRCAVLRQIGSSDDLRPALTFLYGQWLAHSGHELRDFPAFAQRLSLAAPVPEHEAITDLFVPLK